MMRQKLNRAFGFTLLELTVVTAMIAILATITFTFMNPSESIKRARDAVRLSDLNVMKSALVLAIQNGATFLDRCTKANPCNSLTGSNLTDGSGYVDLNLSTYLSHLPEDPLHRLESFTDGKGNLVEAGYEFASLLGDFEIRAHLESRDNTGSQGDRYLDDGGDDDDYLEIGTKLDIL